ncbi:hypothetical protein VD0004_g235 [Verticillium dahliae]|nr:hypothetical protein VD0004_g235 [Verticillium dahliae]PNH77437.1 hypothetical protein VD0001_g161 [Verticillium dahliae]
MLPSTVFSVFALVGSALAQQPPKVNHDSINPVRDTLGPNGDMIRKFQPLLHIAHGCQPYSAVNTRGEVNAGLQDSGTTAGGCKETSKGQTYARSMTLNGQFGIMYAWYWPKDQPADGNLASGHRHDWENVVIWFNSNNANQAGILRGAASGHGDYKKVNNPQRNNNNLHVEYFTSLGKNHELQFKTSPGRTYWIWDWDRMDTTVQGALNRADFGSANCPFNNNNFERNMRAAF